MKTFPALGLGVPEILLPKSSVSLSRWAVVACDQYTSEPEYWEAVDAWVGGEPSTLRLIFPEVYLESPGASERIAHIQAAMRDYLARGLLEAREGFVYVERTVGGHVRRGLLVAIDLDDYDFRPTSRSLVRATEGTIVERLPPRIRVREGAALELPHIMVLLDDPERRVIEPLALRIGELEALYDFELMMKGGHVRGWRVSDPAEEARIVAALESLADPAAFQRRYGLGPEAPVLLYAMGDGNHSLATAKAIWEQVKASAAPAALEGDPRRFALVELVNVHDEALVFEPIHRVLFDLAPGLDLARAFSTFLDGGLVVEPAPDLAGMILEVDADPQSAGLIDAGGYAIARIRAPRGNLAVSSVQPFVGELAASKRIRSVDYVHGTEAVDRLGRRPGNAGIYLPGMHKDELFKTVIVDGVLPRKTFSMGEANEKRFYLEARRLSAGG